MRMRQRPRRNSTARAWQSDLARVGSWSVPLSRGGEPDSKVQAARDKFFEQSVRPCSAEKCYSCHGDKKQKGGLRLDSLQAIFKGGESGPAVVPAKPDESLLVEAINYEGVEMPPSGKLDPAKVAILTRWVSAGAPWPGRDRAAHAPAGDRSRSHSIEAHHADRALWSIQPVRKPTVPDANQRPATDWPNGTRNPIDRFILQAFLKHGLTPAPRPTRRP